MPEPDIVHLQVLGPVVISSSGKRVEKFRSRRVAELFALLAWSRAHRIRRSFAIEVLWPDMDRDAALSNLRQALHFARAAVAELEGPADLMRSDTEYIYLDSTRWRIDVDDLRRTVKRLHELTEEELSEAGARSRRVFAEGIEAPWLEQARENVRGWHEQLAEEARSRDGDGYRIAGSYRPRLHGRNEELARILTDVAAGTPLITVAGVSGIGKSAFLRGLGRALGERGVTTQIWSLDQLVQAMPTVQSTEVALLDLANVASREAAQTVRSAIDLGFAAIIVCAARSRLDLDEETVFRLEPLPIPRADENPADLRRAPCVQAMVESAHAAGRTTAITDAELRDLAQIAAYSGGLPTALRLFGRRLAIESTSDLLHSLDRSESAFDALESCVTAIVEEAPPALLPALTRLSALKGSVSTATAAAVIGERGSQIVAELCDRSILSVVEQGSDPRVALPEPVRRRLFSGLKESDRRDVVRIAGDHLATRYCKEGFDRRIYIPFQTRRQMEPDMRLAAEIVAELWAADQPSAAPLLWMLTRWHESDHRGMYLLGVANAVDACPYSHAPPNFSWLIRAMLLRLVNAYDEAYDLCHRFIAQYEPDDIWKAWAVGCAARCARILPRPDVIPLAERAADLFAKHVAFEGEITMYGRVLTSAYPDHPQMLRAARKAMEIATEQDDLYCQATAWQVMAHALSTSFNPGEARIYELQAVAAWAELDETIDHSFALAQLGRGEEDLDRAEAAYHLYKQAIAGLEQTEESHFLCVALTYYGDLLITRGELQAGIAAHTRSLKLRSRPSMRRGTAINWRGIGRGQFKSGRLSEAEVSLRKSISVYEDYEDTEGVWIARGWLGLTLRALGQEDEARRLLKAVHETLAPLPHSRLNTLGSETALVLEEVTRSFTNSSSL